MTATGFSTERAQPHDEFGLSVYEKLAARGYDPTWLEPEGNLPDLKITDRDGRIALIDIKTRYPDQRNYTVKHGSLAAYWRLTNEGKTVYIVWDDWHIDTVYTLAGRILGGPQRPSGNGSQTDWVLVKPGGTVFDDFFPQRNWIDEL